ncbi:MAG TPA: helix-turn-helix domain-containing protein [Bellilinea sp.]|nr:helix-turn-helix domain-containing protein [Bellilinea sp.]
MPAQTFSSYQAAEFLGLSVRRIQALLSLGVIKANKIGRDWAISEEELQKFKQLDRTAGRPKKKRPEQEKSFLNKASDTYLQVVEIIRALIETEGLDNAYRAFAEAAQRQIQGEVMAGYKPKGLAHVCLYRLLGRRRCPDTYQNPCDSPRIPGQDHVSEWVKDGNTEKIVLQPYYLTYEDMKELVVFCELYELRADVHSESWHFPGKTIRIDISRNKSVTQEEALEFFEKQQKGQ